MSRTEVRRFAIGASVVAAFFGALLLFGARALGNAWFAWSGLGWLLLATLGVAGGAWLAAEYGKPGTGFLKALGAGMLARMLATVGGAACAVLLGPEQAPWAFVTGAGTGFLPLLVFEVWWFYRASRRLQPSQADSESVSDGRKTR
jgi:hypothetical protein